MGPLISLLQDADKDVRACAVIALGKIGDPRAVEPLILMLKDPDWEVRDDVPIALARLADRRASKALIEAFKDEDRDVRGDSAWALSQIKDPNVTTRLIELLNDPDANVRQCAAMALDGARGTPVVEALCEAVLDTDSGVRHYAVRALGETKDSAALGPLSLALGLENDVGTRELILDALSGCGALTTQQIKPQKKKDILDRAEVAKVGTKIKKKRHSDLLVKALDSHDRHLRRDAVRALGHLRDRKSLEHLITALGDSDGGVRVSAAYALGKLADRASTGQLVQALRDEDYEVREAAAYALGRVKDGRAVGPLVETLKDPVEGVRDKAMESLRWMPATAVTPVVALLSSEVNFVREAASKTLARVRPKGPKALLEAVRNLDEEIRIRIAQELASRDIDNTDLLISFSTSPDWKTRHCAVTALSYVVSERPELLWEDFEYRFSRERWRKQSQAILESFARSLNDPEEAIRSTAAWSLGKMNHPAAVPSLQESLRRRQFQR